MNRIIIRKEAPLAKKTSFVQAMEKDSDERIRKRTVFTVVETAQVALLPIASSAVSVLVRVRYN